MLIKQSPGSFYESEIKIKNIGFMAVDKQSGQIITLERKEQNKGKATDQNATRILHIFGDGGEVGLVTTEEINHKIAEAILDKARHEQGQDNKNFFRHDFTGGAHRGLTIYTKKVSEPSKINVRKIDYSEDPKNLTGKAFVVEQNILEGVTTLRPAIIATKNGQFMVFYATAT